MIEAKKEVLVAIPAYNAGQMLTTVLEGVSRQVERAQILVIDDGSTDDTRRHAESYGVKVQTHQKNLGKGAALKTAFAYVLQKTNAHAVISLDADGQHAPEYIPDFIKAFAEDQNDLVIGAREFSVKVMPFFRVLSNKMTSKLLSWKTGEQIKDSQSGYRAYSRRLIANLQLKTNGYETESEILLQACRARMKIAFVPIATIYRGETSHIHGLREILRFTKLYLNS
ncbi:glycosyltransferase family 2 protein [candidate division KSB1 bacterium]|nr:glycosyltransferase family 2 protein [candidate division KSB1 bacterium]